MGSDEIYRRFREKMTFTSSDQMISATNSCHLGRKRINNCKFDSGLKRKF